MFCLQNIKEIYSQYKKDIEYTDYPLLTPKWKVWYEYKKVFSKCKAKDKT